MDLLELSEMENEDEELVPEILPIDARLSLTSHASTLAEMFQSAVAVTPEKGIISGTEFVQVEGFEKSKTSVSYVRISATDGERSIVLLDDTTVVRMSGTVLLPGKKILSILKMIGEESVRIDVVGDSATLRSGRTMWKVAAPNSGKTLPSFSSAEGAEFHPVLRTELLRAFEASLTAVAKTSARQALMQASIAQGSITSCDGVRVHKVEIADLPPSLTTTVPLNFMITAIRELRASSVETVRLGASDSTVLLNFGRRVLMSQKLNFEFPSVDHLLLSPALSNDETLTLNARDLEKAIKRVKVNSDPEYFAITLSLRSSGEEMTLRLLAHDKLGNISEESVEAVFDGPSKPKDLTVNHKYLTDLLGCISEDTVALRLGESTKTKHSPIYVKTENFTGSLMTMALNVIR